jgi:hypothetical protein
MKLLNAAVLALCICFQLFAESDFPEIVNLKDPGAVHKRSFKVSPQENYAVTAKVSSSIDRSAVIEVRLFSGSRQCRFFRTVHSTVKESVLESVFNTGNADRAEISLCVTDDAMPGTTAKFREIRFTPCASDVMAEWNRNPASNCGREISGNGKIVTLYPRRKNVGYVHTSLVKFPANSRMRFSARVNTGKPEMASICVNCGAKNSKSRNYKSNWNSKNDEVLYVDFETEDAEWTTILLRSKNIKKSTGKAKFSEMKVELIQPGKPVQKQETNTQVKGSQKK